MPNCSVMWCKNRTVKQTKSQSNVTYHRFPKEPSLKQKWVKMTGRSPEWIPTSYSTICSIHFEQSLFMASKNEVRTYLDRSAVPTLHLPYHVHAIEKIPTTPVQNNIADEDNDSNAIIIEIEGESRPDTSQKDKDLSAENKKLKNYIRLLEYKHNVNNRKIKRLQYHVRRQKEKIANMENILKFLSDKPYKRDGENDVLIVNEMSSEISEPESLDDLIEDND